MAFHLAVYYESLDPAGNFVELAALADPRIYTRGDNIEVPELDMLVGAGVLASTAASTVARGYVNSPSLNFLGDNSFSGSNLIASNALSTDPPVWNDYSGHPLQLSEKELMRGLITANPAAAGPQSIGVLFSDGTNQQIPVGRRITAFGETSAGGATGAWVEKEVTWGAQLPAGNYAVVGLRVFGATTLWARLNFRTGAQWRPGVMVLGNEQYKPFDWQGPGKMGIWGQFYFTQQPSIEVVQGAATGTLRIYMDVVQTSVG